MKFKLLLLALITSSLSYSMSTIFIKPTTMFPKNRFARPGLTSLQCQIARATIKESFNELEERAPLLAFDGPEDLLNRFLDPTLAFNDTTKVGQALFDGLIKIHEYGFMFEKNFNNNIFFSCNSTVTQGTGSNIQLYPVSKKGQRLTPQQIDADANLKNYLERFNQEILENGNRTFEETVIGPSFFTLGYAKNHQEFKRIDFFNYSFNAGFMLPSIDILDSNTSQKTPFSVPTYARKNIGFPLQVNAEIGFLNWLNIGACGIVIPFVSNDKIVRINPTETKNILLSNDNVLCNIHHKPFIYFSAHFEADEFLPKTTFLAGISYAKQHETTYQPHDEKYECDIVNTYSLHKSWERVTLTLEAQVDFATEEHEYYPRVKFIYTHPFYGKSVYKSTAGAGQIGIDIFASF